MTSRRELKNYAKQAMSGKYGILILAFVAVQALALISSMISSALFPGEETIDIVLSYASSTLPNISFATECPSTQTFSLFVSFDDSIKLPAAIVRLLILT